MAKNFDLSNDTVVPSADFLRSNASIQQQVDARIKEYQVVGAHICQGKQLQSQRARHDVPIKRFVAWPHHYILTGDTKERISYDKLKPTQWMAGVLKAALDLPNDQRI